MAAKKKAATKKRAKKPTPEKGALVAVVNPPVNDDPEKVVAEHLEKVERWRQAWELAKADVPYSTIGQQLGVSKQAAWKWVKHYQEYRGVSPKIEAEREYELAGISFLEGKVIREATKGDISWAVASQAVRGLYADRREILGFDQAEPAKPSVGEGKAGLEGVGVALRLVSGADDTSAA